MITTSLLQCYYCFYYVQYVVDVFLLRLCYMLTTCYYVVTTSLLHVYYLLLHVYYFVTTYLLLVVVSLLVVARFTIFVYFFTVRLRLWYSYPVVIITWVHYLGPPGPSTSQILGTFSRFSETFLAERERGGSLGDPPGP